MYRILLPEQWTLHFCMIFPVQLKGTPGNGVMLGLSVCVASLLISFAVLFFQQTPVRFVSPTNVKASETSPPGVIGTHFYRYNNMHTQALPCSQAFLTLQERESLGTKLHPLEDSHFVGLCMTSCTNYTVHV